MQNSLTFLRQNTKFHEWQAASDFALRPLPLHIHAPLLEDYAGGKIREANFRYVTLPLSWSLYSFFYVLFFKYTIVN